jgi:hypothetical protein
MKINKKIFTDERIALIVRWWVAGAIYFYIGWGTNLGYQNSLIDFIFFLGLSIGVANILVVDPVIRRMFNLKSNIRYTDISTAQKVKMRLSEIFKSMLIVLIIVLTYMLINILLIKILSLSPDAVPFPGEPISFGILYVFIFILFEKVKNRFERQV